MKDFITLHKVEAFSTGTSYKSKRVEVVDGRAIWAHDFKIPLEGIGHVAGGPFYGFAFSKEQAINLEAQKLRTMLNRAKKELKHAEGLMNKLIEFEEEG